MIIPYLTFNGNCAEAFAFYLHAFGAKDLGQMPYGDYVPEGVENIPVDLPSWIVHAEMEIFGSKIWLADELTPLADCDRIKLSVAVPTGNDAQLVFDALKASGVVTLAPTQTFYSVFHAALIDQFGIHWSIVAEEAPSTQEERE